MSAKVALKGCSRCFGGVQRGGGTLNDWMARNKDNLRHPAAWVHSGIHTVLPGVLLGWQWGLLLGALHLVIDTRVPLRWWQKVFRQTTGGDIGLLVSVMSDQVLHIVSIGIVVWLPGYI